MPAFQLVCPPGFPALNWRTGEQASPGMCMSDARGELLENTNEASQTHQELPKSTARRRHVPRPVDSSNQVDLSMSGRIEELWLDSLGKATGGHSAGQVVLICTTCPGKEIHVHGVRCLLTWWPGARSKNGQSLELSDPLCLTCIASLGSWSLTVTSCPPACISL